MADSQLSKCQSNAANEARLWIGNIDSRVSEYQLLKLAQVHGNIKRFDFILHTSGQLAGKPRGFAFISYSTRQEAQLAKEQLANKQVGRNRLRVCWASDASSSSSVNQKEVNESTNCNTKTVEPQRSADTQIRAIEAKLMSMGGASEKEFQVTQRSQGHFPKVKAVANKLIDYKRTSVIKNRLKKVN